MRDFPEAFLVGSSTAAYQIEGGNVNSDWWEWEHRPDTNAVEPSGDAIDHYHRYRSDLQLLADLGLNAHRLSLEWSRIEPAPGEFSRAAIAHYRRVLEHARDLGLTTFVTVHHFSNPRWFSKRGGWLAPDAVDVFARYAQRVSDDLGDLMPWTCTINEPNVMGFEGYRIGLYPPGLRDHDTWKRVTRRFIEAHRAVVDLFPRAGVCIDASDIQGDSELADELRHEMIEIYLDDLRGEFIGLQYYTRMVVDPSHPDLAQDPPPDAHVTQMNWEIYPEGLLKGVRKLASAGLPVVITENGIATTDDTERVAYLQAHLEMASRAIDEGLDLRGYLYWASFDDYMWIDGFRPRFGLVDIDHDDGLRRTPRPSAYALGRVARTGMIDSIHERSPS